MRNGAESSRTKLLYLGDEEMRKYYARKFGEDHPSPSIQGRAFLIRRIAPSGDPELVTLLAPYLFRDDEPVEGAPGASHQ